MWLFCPLLLLVCSSYADDNSLSSQNTLCPLYWSLAADHLLLAMTRAKHFHVKEEGIESKQHWGEENVNEIAPHSQQFPMEHKRVKFRNNAGPSCTCKREFQPRVLGPTYYPPVIPSAHCEPRSCPNTLQTCQQQFYNIRVLRQRNIEQHEPLDTFLPRALRHEWILEEIAVAVSCECCS